MAKEIIEFIFGTALFINALLFIPQSIRIYKEKTAQSVSLTTFIGLLLIQFAIVLHGIIAHDPLLIWGYIVSMVSTGLVVILALKYRNHKVEADTSNLNLEEILMQLPGHIYWKDKNFVMLGCNANNFQDFGLKSLDDFIGKTDYDFFSKEEADYLRLIDEEVIRTGQMKIVEEEVTVENGKKIVYLSHKKPLRNKRNEIIGVIGTTLDVTVARQEINDQLYMLEGIIAVMPGMVYWMNREGMYLGCNDNEAKVIGLSSRNDIVGKKNIDLPGFLISEVLDPVNQKVMEKGETVTLEEPAILPNGAEAIFLSSKVPLRNSKKEVTGLLGISIDITERKQQEQKLIKAMEAAEIASKAKTEFVQNMQHDIRTPSAGLWGVLDVLAKAETDPKKKEALDMAVTASKRLLDLCNDAVEFGDLSGNARPLRLEPLNIRELAQSVIELNQPAAFAKDLLLHFKVDAMVPTTILSDEFRISRILINLMGNAIKFTNKGEVTLSLKADVNTDGNKETRHGILTVEIKDTGIGIAANKVKSIYDKFSRAVLSNTNLYPGTGLGLYVVKTFLDEMDGDIEVQSHENNGTSFKLDIPFKACWKDIKKPGVEIDACFRSPLAKQSVEKLPLNAKVEKTSATKTPFTHEVLIVEDDKTCLFAEKNVLSAFTNKIDYAETMAAALEKLATKRYDLVICDLGLPDGSGCTIVATMKSDVEALNHDTPFVAMTAHRDEQKLREAMQAGFSAAERKPLTREMAMELLNIYPVRGTEQPKNEGLPVIDLALGMQRISAADESTVLEALNILLATLDEDIPLLQQAEKNNDIEKVRAILHKIRGGLYYSGTPRLEETFRALHDEVKRNADLRKIDLLFSLAYDEVKLLAEQYQELIQG